MAQTQLTRSKLSKSPHMSHLNCLLPYILHLKGSATKIFSAF